MTDARTIAEGLTEAQKRYILACGTSETPYEPRHGRTANWALRHGYAEMMWGVGEVEMDWDSVVRSGAIEGAQALGCRLTPLGLEVRTILQNKEAGR